MRSLTSTLLNTQQSSSHVPWVKVEAKNQIAGLVRLDWERLYSGSEDDYLHGVAMPGDGSLIRIRVTLPADGRKLYRQRVAEPGPASDFGSWVYTGQYNCLAVAVAALGAEVSIFWVNSAREVQHLKSTDYGASWTGPQIIDYSITTTIGGLAAVYKPDGDLAVFFADQATLYVKKRLGGSWQAKSAWDKSTGDLSGVATVYDTDWNLLVSGKDTAGNFKLWSLSYGDGGDVAPGVWSALKECASAPADSGFEYSGIFLDKPDTCRCFYTEKFTGNEAYCRPLWSAMVPGTAYLDSLWREPTPCNLTGSYGLAMAHHGSCRWLSTPSGVWRASASEINLNLTSDIVSLKQEINADGGKLVIELRNDDGKYSSLPATLDSGCQLEVSPGYVTPAGNEASAGQSFTLEGYEYVSAGGKASLLLYASDGWRGLENWSARHQFRWNSSYSEAHVKQILEFILARVGLKLEVISQSEIMAGYYPDFAIYCGDAGKAVIRKLLSSVPDVLFIEGNMAYLLNPQPDDSPAYSYGQAHPVLEGQYRSRAWAFNHIEVEGYDPVTGEPIMTCASSWDQIARFGEMPGRVEDRNLETLVKAQQRGVTLLRKAEMGSAGGFIRVPVNCGQQLYDVVDVTDERAGLVSARRRVLGLTLVYDRRRGLYEQRLVLGEV